jgi:hypothetical protein
MAISLQWESMQTSYIVNTFEPEHVFPERKEHHLHKIGHFLEGYKTHHGGMPWQADNEVLDIHGCSSSENDIASHQPYTLNYQWKGIPDGQFCPSANC